MNEYSAQCIVYSLPETPLRFSLWAPKGGGEKSLSLSLSSVLREDKLSVSLARQAFMYITKVDLNLQLKEHERYPKCPLVVISGPFIIFLLHNHFITEKF